jgi:hypothetical protein
MSYNYSFSNLENVAATKLPTTPFPFWDVPQDRSEDPENDDDEEVITKEKV